jgi:hypothetical protein
MVCDSESFLFDVYGYFFVYLSVTSKRAGTYKSVHSDEFRPTLHLTLGHKTVRLLLLELTFFEAK